MEVLLRQDVEGLGELGDVVDVAPGYARNYLLPRKLAVEVNEANLALLRRQREARRQREREELARVEELAGKLEGFLCYITARATDEGHLYGSVGPEEVAEALVRSGFESIRPASIHMPAHIEQLGDHELEVILHPKAKAHITVRVAPLEEPDEQD